MLKDDTSNVFNFQQCFLCGHSSNRRCNSGTKISVVTWQAVHEHIVADVFHSKKSPHVCMYIYIYIYNVLQLISPLL